MRRLFPILCVLALAGCEIYAVPSALVCPGTKQATFNFVGVLAPSTTTACSFASQASNPLSFSGTVAYDADGGACLSRNIPHAVLNLGTHVGDSIDVGTVDFGGGLSGCACPAGTNVQLVIAQRITGDISRDGTTPTTFDGGFLTAVSAANADGSPANLPPCACGTVEADGGCTCTIPCALQYDLQATAVQSP